MLRELMKQMESSVYEGIQCTRCNLSAPLESWDIELTANAATAEVLEANITCPHCGLQTPIDCLTSACHTLEIVCAHEPHAWMVVNAATGDVVTYCKTEEQARGFARIAGGVALPNPTY